MKPPGGGTTAREAMFTMRPRPAPVIAGSTARQPSTAVLRLSVIMRFHSARDVEARSPAREAAHRVDQHVHPPVPLDDAGDEPARAASSVTSQAAACRRGGLGGSRRARRRLRFRGHRERARRR